MAPGLSSPTPQSDSEDGAGTFGIVETLEGPLRVSPGDWVNHWNLGREVPVQARNLRENIRSCRHRAICAVRRAPFYLGNSFVVYGAKAVMPDPKRTLGTHARLGPSAGRALLPPIKCANGVDRDSVHVVMGAPIVRRAPGVLIRDLGMSLTVKTRCDRYANLTGTPLHRSSRDC